MATERPTLYKMVTPPKGEGTGGMGNLVKSMNSLGGTINSIAFIAADMNKNFAKGIKHQISKQEDISKKHSKIENQKLADRKKKENALKKLMNRRQDQDAEDNQKASLLGRFGGTLIKAAKGALGFFEGIAKALEAIFVGFVQYAVFKWLGKKENQKKVKKFLDFMSSLGKFIVWAVTGLVNMGLDGITDFLENPVSFEGLFGLVKFLTALGLLFAPGATVSLALQGVIGLFRKGRLIPMLKGLFTGVWSLLKGLVAFVLKRPRAAAVLLAGAGAVWLAATGLKALKGEDDEESDKFGTMLKGGKADTEYETKRGLLVKEEIDLEEEADRLTDIHGVDALDMPRYKEIQIRLEEIDKEEEQLIIEHKNKSKKKNEKLPEKKQGGVVIPSNPFLPMDMGGWITGPQSGYPVSLDGGGSTSFIGHGTEWVGFPKASRGGAFVVPFDTPSTRANPSLTKKRLGEAKRGGFAMPSFDMGGFYPQMQIGGELKQPTTATTSMNLGQAAKELQGMSTATGPDGGANSCAWAVNKVFKKAGMTPPWGDSLWVPDAEKAMKAAKYKEIEYAKRQAGDIMVMYDNHATMPQAHIGIVLPSGDVLSNSSSNAAFSWQASPESYDEYYGNKGKIYRSPKVVSIKNANKTTNLEKVDGDEGVESIQPSKAWWDPLGLFSGKPSKQASSGNTLGEAALKEDLKMGAAADDEADVTVQPMQLPTIDATPPAAAESIPEPIFVPNEYEPPSNPYVQARFGLMADVTAEPSRLY